MTSTALMPDEVRLLDADGLLVGIIPARVKRVQQLANTDTLDVEIAGSYTKADGTTEDRWPLVDDGYQILYGDGRYLVDDPDTDFETGGVLQCTSAEVELRNFNSNQSPGGCAYLNRTPTQIIDAVLAGKIARRVRNPGFGILDADGLPTNWTHSTDWVSTVVANRRVWQAPSGGAASDNDTIPVTRGIVYSATVECGIGTATSGSWSLQLVWVAADGTETAEAADTRLVSAGPGQLVGTQFAAKESKVRLRLAPLDTNGSVWFDDALLYEHGPDTGWTYDGSMDSRPASIPYSDGAWVKYGVWTPSTDHTYSTAVGDYAAHVFNGPFVSVLFKGGGAGALAKVRLNGVVKETALDVSSDTTYTLSGLDPAESHVLEVEVAAVKVGVKSLTVSDVNLISMRWNFITVFEALAAVRQAVGGELGFDTVNRVITHAPTIGRDLTADDIIDFRRGSNITSFRRTGDRTQIVNQLTGLGYGSGEYQLKVTVDATATQ